MTYHRSDGRQEVVNAGVEPGHSTAYDRTFGGAANRVLATIAGTTNNYIGGPCVFAGVELTSGAAVTVSAYEATAATSNPFWSRSLSTYTGDGPPNGAVIVANLFITLSATAASAKVFGIPST